MIWETNGGLWAGFQQEKRSDRPSLKHELTYKGDRMALWTGPNGSGKTKRIALVNLCRLLGWSVVVVDTKGALCAMTHKYRADNGCQNFIFNPANQLDLGTMTHNPIASLDADSDYLIDDVMEHAETVIAIDKDTRERHWPESSQDLFSGMEMYVRAVLEGTIEDLRAIVSQSDREIRRMIKNDPFKYKGKDYPPIKTAAISHKLPEMYYKVARFQDMKAEDRELHSIFSTMLTQTRSFDSRLIKKVMSGEAVDFSILKQKPCTIYLIVPPRRLLTYAKWLRWMIASILQCLMQDIKRANVPVLLLIDEAYPILKGGFPIIENNYAQLREFGVKIGMMFQSLAQPIELFGENGFESYVGNAGLFQNFAPQDNVTAEYLSRMSGETTEWHGTSGGQRGWGGGNASVNQSGGMSEFARPLFLPHEMREMEDGWTVAWSHKWKGTALSYMPYPTELSHMRNIMRLDPSL